MWPIFAGAVGIHIVYKVLQAMTYSRGAFTVVYPVVRGTGPVVTRSRIEAGLAELGATVFSRAARRTPTLLVRFEGIADEHVRDELATRGISVPCGTFYALEASRRLGLGDSGALRIGLAPYSDDTDVDRLLEALTDIHRNAARG